MEMLTRSLVRILLGGRFAGWTWAEAMANAPARSSSTAMDFIPAPRCMEGVSQSRDRSLVFSGGQDPGLTRSFVPNEVNRQGDPQSQDDCRRKEVAKRGYADEEDQHARERENRACDPSPGLYARNVDLRTLSVLSHTTPLDLT